VPTDEPLFPLDDPWCGYATTVVEVTGPRPDDTVIVAAAPTGEVGRWPWAALDVIYVLTAWDPGERRFSEDVNRRRQAKLEEELRPLARCMWSARGYDAASAYRNEGVAVSGAREADVLAAGARFGQDAVFAWTATEWTIVGCTGGRRLPLGWRIVDLPLLRQT
jgi:hypothetical protein